MLAHEGAALAEQLRLAVEHDAARGQLAPALARVGEEDADAAVDVDHRVAPGRAGPQPQLVELVALLVQVQRQRLQRRGTLVERHLAQRRTAHLARVPQHLGQIDPFG